MVVLIEILIVALLGLHGPYWLADRMPAAIWESERGAFGILLGIIVLKIAGLVVIGWIAWSAVFG